VTGQDSTQDAKYKELAHRICGIAKVDIDAHASIDEILKKLRDVQQTPYLTSAQKEAREILNDIIEDIERKGSLPEIEMKIKKFEDAIEYDIYWD
jgi:hypothetical protein